MPNQPLQQRGKDDALGLSLLPLSQALAAAAPGRECQWAEEVVAALGRVETALRQHLASAKAPDGVLGEVDETRPTLARQADAIRKGYDVFLTRVLTLREEVQRAADAFQPAADPSARTRNGEVVDLGTIRQQGDRLVDGLHENKEAESKLVLESANTDLGAGD